MIRRPGFAWAALLLGLLPLAGTAASGAESGRQAPADPPGVVHLSAEQQRTVELALATPERRPITELVRVPGTVAFDPGHVAVLRPLSAAVVLRLLATPGQTVRAGQTLAELGMPVLADDQAALDAARATVRETDTGVAVARDALHRGEVLARDGALAVAEAQRRRLVLAQAEAAAEAARARVRALTASVARLHPGGAPGIALLSSPMAGVVVAVGLTQGGLAETAREAFTVADLSVMQVLAQVPEANAALVAVGDPAEVRLAAGSGGPWHGSVATLAAALDSQSRTLAARIILPNPDTTLRAGMFVGAALTASLGREDLTIPPGAVQMVGDRQVAFVPLGDGRFQSHNLTLGVQRADWVEVRSGLDPGEQVVTRGSFTLKALLQKQMQNASDAGKAS